MAAVNGMKVAQDFLFAPVIKFRGVRQVFEHWHGILAMMPDVTVSIMSYHTVQRADSKTSQLKLKFCVKGTKMFEICKCSCEASKSEPNSMSTRCNCFRKKKLEIEMEMKKDITRTPQQEDQFLVSSLEEHLRIAPRPVKLTLLSDVKMELDEHKRIIFIDKRVTPL